MVLYYLLLAPCISIWNSTNFYWSTAYTYGILLSSNGPCISPWYSTIVYWPMPLLWYSTIFYWLPSYPCGTLLSSTVQLPKPMIFYCLPMAPANPLCSLLSSTGSLPIHVVLYYLLLSHCLYLWYSTVFQ